MPRFGEGVIGPIDSPIAVGDFGFLTLIQFLDRPERYGASRSLRQSFQAKLTNRLKHFCAIGVLDPAAMLSAREAHQQSSQLVREG